MVIMTDDISNRASVVFDGVEESRQISQLLVIDVKEGDIEIVKMASWRKRLRDHQENLFASANPHLVQQKNKKQKPSSAKKQTQSQSSQSQSQSQPVRERQPPRRSNSRHPPMPKPVDESEFKFQDEVDVVWERDEMTNMPVSYTRLSDDIDEIEQKKIESLWKNDLTVDGMLLQSQDGTGKGKPHIWGPIAQADLNKERREMENESRASNEILLEEKKHRTIKASCSRELPFERARPLASWSVSDPKYSDNNRNLHLGGKGVEDGSGSGGARANRVNKRRDDRIGWPKDRDPMDGRGVKVRCVVVGGLDIHIGRFCYSHPPLTADSRGPLFTVGGCLRT
jgi:hypothetical protein